MAESDVKARDFVGSFPREPMKIYIDEDAQGRPALIYEALASAKVGDPCLLTTNQFRNGTSTTIIKSAESKSTWPAGAD